MAFMERIIGCYNNEKYLTAKSLIEASANGIGKNVGQAALAEAVGTLDILYGIKTGIKMDKLRGLSILLEDLSRVPTPANKPLAGEYAFADNIDEVTAKIVVDPLIHYCVNGTVKNFV
jgi:hypothetical protein